MGEAIHIRTYRDDDLPAVLELLRASLGEAPLLRRTEELFRWKHIDNPFGRSVLMVAEADETIVGLRAFMQWHLKYGAETIRCARAVDTATHPNYQRKGIFRRLTMEALDVAREAGLQLIFNTPNERSRPGYLKMGWSDVGPIRVLVRPHPTRLFRARRASFPRLDELAPIAIPIESTSPNSAETNLSLPSGSDTAYPGLHTPRSNAYLQWRFSRHPTARYGAVPGSSGTAILRANLRNRRSELVIADALGADPTEAVRSAVRASQASYDVAAFPAGSAARDATRRAGMLAVPVVAALRLVAFPIDALEIDVFNPRSWSLALSDLELL
jgi:GNAT superfamily N-acetyltransferase